MGDRVLRKKSVRTYTHARHLPYFASIACPLSVVEFCVAVKAHHDAVFGAG